jgi:hypothetical protein
VSAFGQEGYKALKTPKTQRAIRRLPGSFEEAQEMGFYLGNRARVKSKSQANAWDDRILSAWYEIPR